MKNKTTGNHSPIITGDGNTVINYHSNKEIIQSPSNILVFDGSDTLTLSNIMQDLSREGINDFDCNIQIDGFDNKLKKEITIFGRNGLRIIDGYVRSLLFEDDEKKELIDVGGSNATSERVAAKKISLILTNVAYKHLTDNVAHYYDSQLKKMMTHDDRVHSTNLASNAGR